MTTPFKYVHTGGDCLPYIQTSASPGAEAAGFLWHLTCLLTILGERENRDRRRGHTVLP